MVQQADDIKPPVWALIMRTSPKRSPERACLGFRIDF